jgi:predicted dehydrogenase
MPGKRYMNRRKFIEKTTAAVTFTIVPRNVLGGRGYISPSEKINIACIGVGSQGIRVMMNFLQRPDVKIVSICDVNKESYDYCEWWAGELKEKVRNLIGNERWGGTTIGAIGGREPARQIVDAYYSKNIRSGAYKACSSYNDFRELIREESDIDAIVIGTPDHLHAVISMLGLKNGKHLYCQKPFTHSVYEAHRLAQVAKKAMVVTQVATAVHASESTRLLCEWIWDGAIGAIHEVHNWSNRPFWPQGCNRPAESEPVPINFDWDLWLGPAPFRPYHRVYQPFVWRGWKDFGTGALGDMGCYSFDTIFRVLKLGAPTSVEACGSFEYKVEHGLSLKQENKETYSRASLIQYHFPAREEIPPVTIHWYDGGLKPMRPLELEQEREMPEEGLMFVGEKGKILCNFSGGSPRLIPESAMQAYKRPPKSLPRSIGHIEEWLRACHGGEPADANFEFAGQVTEALLLGNIALEVGKKIEWDAKNLRVSNIPRANEYLHTQYRDEWNL